jgi:sulfite exporter TauE/SafE
LESEAPAVLLLGLILGIRHALDADHVVAVSTIVSKNKNLLRSSLLGAVWGLGHTSTLFLVGLLVLIFKLTIPYRVALSMEFAVGIVLVILGLSVTKEFLLDKMHLHPHKHGNKIHLHLHSHRHRPDHSHEHEVKPEHKTFLVGMLHGLAGSAALMLLVLTTVSSLYQGLLYILIFGLGSILGMTVISTAISLPFTYTVEKFEELNYKIRLTTGFISIALGMAIIFQIGFKEGLIYPL